MTALLIIQKTNHVTEGIALLLEQYKKLSDIKGIITLDDENGIPLHDEQGYRLTEI